MIKKIPDAEFSVMKVVWANEPPISAGVIMEHLGKKKTWKVHTAISLLQRLVERGFLRTEKNGRERVYYPIVGKEDYLTFETQNFMQVYHENSFASFISTLYDNAKISEEEKKEIIKMLNEGGE